MRSEARSSDGRSGSSSPTAACSRSRRGAPGGRRPSHGDEALAAVLCDPDGAPVEVSEALLSTEYGPDGVQRRATLELWIDGEEGQPLRGAGTLISTSSVDRPGLTSEVAFFRWSLEGREGLGHYEIVCERWLSGSRS